MATRQKVVQSGIMERLEVDDAVIEYEVQGDGEPVLLIPLSVIIDGLGRPLLAEPELAAHYRLIHYRRRGYMGSTLGSEPLTSDRQASDAASLLRHLGVTAAHIVGHSFGGLIALQLAVDNPELVHSLALLEPPLRMVPGAQASVERNILPMMGAYRSGNKRQAVEIFGDNIFGPEWQAAVEQACPGGVEQAIQDVDTFVKELSAIQEWNIGVKEVAAIRQPVLSVVGIRGHEVMVEGRKLLHSWFPQTEDLDVNATHLLQMQDAKGMAHGLARFFSQHPIV